ncbi:MAG TPA: hypothetical protein VE988_15765, partial [Gemmataceae bacterium]|nr:hypothetical protein [Gemmataceae bacterium]
SAERCGNHLRMTPPPWCCNTQQCSASQTHLPNPAHGSLGLTLTGTVAWIARVDSKARQEIKPPPKNTQRHLVRQKQRQKRH